MTLGRNVELKARDPDPAATLAAALAHGARDEGVLVQRDTYFGARRGRLKLREEQRQGEAPSAQLIAYARADEAAARTSAYRVVPVPDPAALGAALEVALGVTAIVAKRRRLLLWQGVRIELEGLGSWVELEAVAQDGSDLAAEHAKVAELRAVLGMADERVVADGYAALLSAASAPYSAAPMTIARVAPGSVPADWTITVPGSKSITNRMLLLAALADGTSRVANALDADDTRVMLDAIRALGVGVRPGGDGAWEVDGLGGGPHGGTPGVPLELWCGMAGTVARFLVPVCAAGRGRFAFTADPQLLGRPLGPLLAALADQGAELDPAGASALPFVLTAHGLRGGDVAVDTSVSSQFLSGLLLAAPLARAASRFAVDLPVSASYVDLTLDALRAFGADVRRDEHEIAIAPGTLRAADLSIEPDTSTASYFLAAAAVTGTTVTMPGLDLDRTRQGDAQLAVLLERMGCRIERRGPLTLQGPTDPGELRGIEADMRDCSDVFMTLACVAPFAATPTTITGIGNVRVKESDRIAAVEQNLARLGIATESGADWLRVHPGEPTTARLPTFRDHRIAMAFSVIGLRVPVELEEPEVVDKTCPPFFDLWRATGADVRLG